MAKKNINEIRLRQFTDAFFDGLKTGAINTALDKAKKSKTLPPPIVRKMDELDRAARELEKMLKELE